MKVKVGPSQRTGSFGDTKERFMFTMDEKSDALFYLQQYASGYLVAFGIVSDTESITIIQFQKTTQGVWEEFGERIALPTALLSKAMKPFQKLYIL